MEVKVHLSEGSLHVPDMVRGVTDKVRPVSPYDRRDAYLIVGTGGTGEEPIEVEALEPLAIRISLFRPGTFFTWRAFTSFTSNPVLFQDLEGSDRVHPCQLHGYRSDTALLSHLAMA